MKLITVFTPTYNRAYILKKCYDSLVVQTSENFVWQIIDDGSTDNTRDLVEQFVSDGKIEIEYYYKENGGKVLENEVVVAKNIITSRAPGTAIPFGLTLVKCLFGAEKAAEVQRGLIYKHF